MSQQRRLSDPRLATEHQHLTLARPHVRQQEIDRLALPASAVQHVDRWLNRAELVRDAPDTVHDGSDQTRMPMGIPSLSTPDGAPLNMAPLPHPKVAPY